MRSYALALDLKDDPKLIKEYKEYHTKMWPKIEASILDSGIDSMRIYLIMNRLFMLIEVQDNFSFELKSNKDRSDTLVQEWEELMWSYQQSLPCAKKGEKWVLMEKIYDLSVDNS